jgi:nucleoid-associated protein YgaU
MMEKKSDKFRSAADLMKEQADKLADKAPESVKKSAKFQSAADMMKEQASKLEEAQDDAKKTATKVTNLMSEQAKKVAGGEKVNRNFATASAAPKTYTVVSGDSLSSIAKAELGDSAHWKALYEANKELIGDDPNRLRIGQTLTLPKVG